MALFETSDKVMLVFVAFSIPFYILFLLTIFINRHKEPFNSPFFILCFSLGLADVATLFHTYIFVKAPGWSWGNLFWVEYGYPGSFLSYYVFMVLWALSFAQNIGVVLIAINRFTAVVFTFCHQGVSIFFQSLSGGLITFSLFSDMVDTKYHYRHRSTVDFTNIVRSTNDDHEIRVRLLGCCNLWEFYDGQVQR